MQSLRHLVASLNNLEVFESAGRLSSFSAAARELGMTQAAVSYAIARLEEQLGMALFLREYRRVRLSEAGRTFHADVAMGLSHIHRSALNLRATANSGHVTLSCSTAYAAFWMVPRMKAFRGEMPEIDLRIQTSDHDLNIEGEGIPLAVRAGDPSDWPKLAAQFLAVEEIYPVCSPAYLARFNAPSDAEALLSHSLIHLDEPFRAAPTWSEWFRSVGVEPDRMSIGLEINEYVLVIQSVIEGEGIALGWHHLIDGLVAKGLLTRVTDHTHLTGRKLYVTWPSDIPLSPPARRVRDWLVAQHSRA